MKTDSNALKLLHQRNSLDALFLSLDTQTKFGYLLKVSKVSEYTLSCHDRFTVKT